MNMNDMEIKEGDIIYYLNSFLVVERLDYIEKPVTKKVKTGWFSSKKVETGQFEKVLNVLWYTKVGDNSGMMTGIKFANWYNWIAAKDHASVLLHQAEMIIGKRNKDMIKDGN
jgi:hypothetical protein